MRGVTTVEIGDGELFRIHEGFDVHANFVKRPCPVTRDRRNVTTFGGQATAPRAVGYFGVRPCPPKLEGSVIEVHARGGSQANLVRIRLWNPSFATAKNAIALSH